MANLRGDYTNLLSNRVFVKFMSWIEERKNYYEGELMSNPDIGRPAPLGEFWQMSVKLLGSILDAPVRIVNGEDKD